MSMTDAKRYLDRFNEANMSGDVNLIAHSASHALSIINAERTSQSDAVAFVASAEDRTRINYRRSRFLVLISVALAALGVFGPIALGLLSTEETEIPSVAAAVTASENSTFALRFAEDVIELPPTIGVSAIPSDSPLAARLAEYAVLLQDQARGAQAAEDIRQPRSETTGAHP